MISISKEIILSYPYPDLIEEIGNAFAEGFSVPQRHHHNYPNKGHQDSTLLLMPAWDSDFMGVKLIAISPENSKYKLPSIQGTYTLFEVKTGRPVAMLDAKALTTKRTAATSALASGFLSRKDAEILLIVGTGALAPELIRAHMSNRPIKKVLIWGRNPSKAAEIAEKLKNEYPIEVATDLDTAVMIADIICTATLSTRPLVKGHLLKPGTHLDLVGAYRGDMREADDTSITISRLFVDTVEGATSESGELSIPLKHGTIQLSDIKADLSDLCKVIHPGRTNDLEITAFKSSGHAIEDLRTSEILYKKIIKE